MPSGRPASAAWPSWTFSSSRTARSSSTGMSPSLSLRRRPTPMACFDPDVACRRPRSRHELLEQLPEILLFLRGDLAVEHARFPAPQLLLHVIGRAWAEQQHEELLVGRQVALAAHAHRARAR